MAAVNLQAVSATKGIAKRLSYLSAHVRRHWFIYMLMLPGFVLMVVFSYLPMYGILVAFKDLNIRKGILGSPWVGLENFRILFQESYFYKVIANTVLINVYNLAFGFPFVIFLALMLNE